MSPKNYTNRFLSHDDINRSIIPCKDKKENVKCPCGRGHLLHHEKEPLAYYNGKVWGLWCAITAEFDKANYELSLAADKIVELETLLGEGWTMRIKKLQFKDAWKEYAVHGADCDFVTLSSIGRTPKDSDCTCGFLSTNKLIMELVGAPNDSEKK